MDERDPFDIYRQIVGLAKRNWESLELNWQRQYDRFSTYKQTASFGSIAGGFRA